MRKLDELKRVIRELHAAGADERLDADSYATSCATSIERAAHLIDELGEQAGPGLTLEEVEALRAAAERLQQRQGEGDE